MTERLELYKCNICGNLVEVILSGVGELVCCGEPMEYLEAKKNDSEYGEKHVPVFSATDNQGEEVRVGSTLHPMTEEHYIQFVETIAKDRRRTESEYFYPSDEPIMMIKDKLGLEKARAFCNLHGLWDSSPEGE